MSALTLQYGADGLISERHLAFYRERAQGEVGLLLSEQLSASPLGGSCFAHSLNAYDERQIGRFQQIAATLRPFDTRFFAQLFSAGAAGLSTVGISDWAALRAPSAVSAPGGELPTPLSVDEIAQITRDYANSARNVRAGHLHGVEIHGAHGWLIGQFLSPFYNRRQDGYGGSVENRCRLAIEIGRAIRAAIGDDFPVGISLTYDELLGDAGITPMDTLEQLRCLQREAIFDFFDLSLGSSHQQHYTIGSMAVPEGPTLEFSARARNTVGPSAAIFTSGRIIDIKMADRAIESGQADAVAMSRGLLADPHLFARARRGQSARTRCVGANHCVARALRDQPVTCVLNPVAGREREWAQPAPTQRSKRVAVIGGGPAGMRYAASMARMGHSVVLYESKRHLGGHLHLLAQLPTREAWLRAIEDMAQAMHSSGVHVRLDTPATVDNVLADHPEKVVIATGSDWVVPADMAAAEGGPPVSLALDTAIEVAMAAADSSGTFGQRALIYDSFGTYAPLGLADTLSSRGVLVTLVTPDERLSQTAFEELDMQHVMPRLAERGVQRIIGHIVSRRESGTVTLSSAWGGQTCRIDKVDSLVFACSRQPRTSVFDALRTQHPDVERIGDALSPRSTAAVIHEAEALARREDFSGRN